MAILVIIFGKIAEHMLPLATGCQHRALFFFPVCIEPYCYLIKFLSYPSLRHRNFCFHFSIPGRDTVSYQVIF